MRIRQANTENFVLEPVHCNDPACFVLQIIFNQPPFIYAADCVTRTMSYFDPRFERF